jgi:type III secretion system low calcium response chaperone LcrH/SycD
MSEIDYEDILVKLPKGKEKELEQAFKGISDKIFTHSMTPKEAFRVSDDRIEGLYAEGYRLFTSGKFQKSIPLFEMLMLIDPTDTRFMLGMASALYGLNRYQEALFHYLGVSRLDEKAVEPLFYASECSLHLGEPNTALLFLEMALNRAGDNEEWARLKERALLMKRAIIHKVKRGGVK